MLKPGYYTEPTELDKQIFEKLVHPNHYLRQVKKVIDFDIFRVRVKDCYSPSMGRPAEDPVMMNLKT
jgi:transposase